MSIVITEVFCAPVLSAAPALYQWQSFGSRDTLAAANLSLQEVREIVKSVEQSVYDTPDSWSEELRAIRINLGGGLGLLLQGTQRLCGGTGDCQLFVLRKVNGFWLWLLPSKQTLLAESFQFGLGVTGGIKDLTVHAY